VLHFEVPSATGWRFSADQFDPTYWVDVSASIGPKLAALTCYGPEIKPWPHARSMQAIEALMRWRGASVGVEAAEAFEISLWVQD
jgi:LmbE family N-acetylglucosaminyl deacetylase